MYSPKQADVMLNADARWNILYGATRSGKTHISYDLLLKRMRTQPPGECLLIGKTERTLKRNVLNPMRERFGEKYVSRVYGDGEISLFGRHCYVIGANDERAVTKIQGMGLVYAYGDEVTTWPQSFFEMLKSRLDKPGAKFDGTCNPEGPYHWLKKDFLDKADELNLKYWHFTLDDNPFLDEEFVQSLKREYSGVWYQRYILGRWVMAEGVIYDMFSESDHVVKKLPKMKKRWVGVDYGTTNPTVFLLLGLGADDNLYVISEWSWDSKEKGRQMTDKEYSEAFRKWCFKNQVVPSSVFVDPSAKSFMLQLNRDGVRRVIAADNSVEDGIRVVSSLLGMNRLFVHESCKGVIEEFHAYVWDEKAQERGEDKPVKANDHRMDALRYGIYSMPSIWRSILKEVA